MNAKLHSTLQQLIVTSPAPGIGRTITLNKAEYTAIRATHPCNPSVVPRIANLLGSLLQMERSNAARRRFEHNLEGLYRSYYTAMRSAAAIEKQQRGHLPPILINLTTTGDHYPDTPLQIKVDVDNFTLTVRSPTAQRQIKASSYNLLRLYDNPGLFNSGYFIELLKPSLKYLLVRIPPHTPRPNHAHDPRL